MCIIRLDVDPVGSPLGPPCPTCGTATRLVGIEPHPTADRTDLRTYQCVMCGQIHAEVVPLLG